MTPKEALESAHRFSYLTREAVRDAMAALDLAIKNNDLADVRLREAEVAWAIRAERDSKRRGRR